MTKNDPIPPRFQPTGSPGVYRTRSGKYTARHRDPLTGKVVSRTFRTKREAAAYKAIATTPTGNEQLVWRPGDALGSDQPQLEEIGYTLRHLVAGNRRWMDARQRRIRALADQLAREIDGLEAGS